MGWGLPTTDAPGSCTEPRWTWLLGGFLLGGEAGGHQEVGQATDRESEAKPRADPNQKQGGVLKSDCSGPAQPSVVDAISNGRQGGQRSEALEATVRTPMVPWVKQQNSRARDSGVRTVNVEPSNPCGLKKACVVSGPSRAPCGSHPEK